MTNNYILEAQGQDGQNLFADDVNDHNPVHVDELAARSSMFGRTIVHGVHSTIRQLDKLLGVGMLSWITPKTAITIKVDYRQPTYPDDLTRLEVSEHSETNAKIDIWVNELKVGIIKLKRVNKGTEWQNFDDSNRKSFDLTQQTNPVDHTLDELASLNRFDVNFATSEKSFLAKSYPHAIKAFGINRLHHIAHLSSVVGMVSPGLYSLFVGFTATLRPEPKHFDSKLSYSCCMDSVHQAFRFVNYTTQTELLYAKLETICRPRPEIQPSLVSITSERKSLGLKLPDMKNKTALVIGGSRGIGATVVKLLASAGAKVTFTYTSNKKAADNIINELKDLAVTSLHYDVMKSVDADDLTNQHYDHIYYFATPQIFVRKTVDYDYDLLQKFSAFYIDGFFNVYKTFSKSNSSVFYPSTVAVESSDMNTLEYRLSKLSGEGLCRSLQQKNKTQTFVISRLPRLASDQTATIQGGENENTIKVFCEILNQMAATSGE
jgi:hypothetical protein